MSHPDPVINSLHRELTAQANNSAWWGLGAVPPWADSAISTIRAVVSDPDDVLFSTSHLESIDPPNGYIAVITRTHLIVAQVAGETAPDVAVTRLSEVGTVVLSGGSGIVVPDMTGHASPGDGVWASVDSHLRPRGAQTIRVAIPSGSIQDELRPRFARALKALLMGEDLGE